MSREIQRNLRPVPSPSESDGADAAFEAEFEAGGLTDVQVPPEVLARLKAEKIRLLREEFHSFRINYQIHKAVGDDDEAALWKANAAKRYRQIQALETGEIG